MTERSSLILPAVAAAALAGVAAAQARPPAPAPPAITQWSVRETVIMRIPVRPEAGPVQWKEKEDRRCIDVRSIAKAALISPEALDFTLRSGERWRLKFRDECPAIAFYRGFYLRPSEDGKICARRDTIHIRSGGECEIRNFRRLKPDDD